MIVDLEIYDSANQKFINNFEHQNLGNYEQNLSNLIINDHRPLCRAWGVFTGAGRSILVARGSVVDVQDKPT